MQWGVYIIECETPDHIYVGMSNNISRRLAQHRAGKGSKFTREHGVKKLLRAEFFENRKDTEAFERQMTKHYRSLPNICSGVNPYPGRMRDRVRGIPLTASGIRVS